MFMPPITNINLQRTIRPLYAHTQATPWAGFIDPEVLEEPTVDIYPGSVMYRKEGEMFAPVTDAATQKPFGLAALFLFLFVDERRRFALIFLVKLFFLE